MADNTAATAQAFAQAWEFKFKHMHAWREMWLGRCLRAGPTDRPAFETAAEACYRAAGEPWHGNVVWMPSPMGAFRLPADTGTPAHDDPRHRKLELFAPALRQALSHMQQNRQLERALDLGLEQVAIRANQVVNAMLIEVIEKMTTLEWSKPHGRGLLPEQTRLNTLHNARRGAEIDHVTPSPGFKRVAMQHAASLVSLNFIRDELDLALPGNADECLQAFEAASKEVLWWYPTSHYVLACERPTAIHVESADPAGRASTRACSHYFSKMRCGSKSPCARRETQAGRRPGEASQRRAWPFWPQPEGNGLHTAPLFVALLGQTSSLAVGARLDWRCVQPIRTWKNSVNRP